MTDLELAEQAEQEAYDYAEANPSRDNWLRAQVASELADEAREEARKDTADAAYQWHVEND